DVLESLLPQEREVRTQDDRWYLRRIFPYRTLDNRIDGTVVTFTDVTQLKAASERLRRLASVLVESNDAVIVFDFDGHIRAWNGGAERMYGYTEAEALKLKIDELMDQKSRTELKKLIDLLRKGQSSPTFEDKRVDKDGQVIDVSVALTCLRDDSGKPNAVAA